MISKKAIASFFIVLFITITCAPTIIASLDNSIDTSVLFGLNEEEEIEDAKLLFEVMYFNNLDFDIDFSYTDEDFYTYKKYAKPYLNIIFPPPDKILC